MESRSRKIIVSSALCLLVVLLACGLPEAATPTALPTIPQQAGGDSPTPPPGETPIAVATDTPPPDVPGPGDCTFNAAFVSDLTVPDGTEFAPNASFIKSWRVRNSGTCNWDIGTKLAFISGDQMGGPSEVAVSPTAAGATVDISVNLQASPTPGTYKGNWQMQKPDGIRFGSVLFVKIVVPAPATDTPTPTPTSTPTSTPTDGCVPPDAALKPILDHAEGLGYDMGCPTAPAFLVKQNGNTGAFQEFWANVDDPNPHTHYRSLMIWRSDNRELYVIVGRDTNASSGTILAYTDTWEEGQPAIHPDCAAITPPTGYIMPVRGFGKIWCTEELEDDIGWPALPEAQVNLRVQPMQAGLLMKVSGPIPTGYLIAMDYRAVEAVTLMISP